ncbi:site-2 protease family protein [Urechidicola croceus]|uniref:Zinc metalloprotease n=1 Tax=Urechidicola croceus TaxID=1850246 RepID=A0A1D8P7Z2_9FLAO|nr:site-2 protease family protein [Urechidicola croceus]AOW20679.1 site-2 protease family protein [Urechidicola croceus]
MKGNLKLGSVFGIKVLVHWTFIFLIIWVVFSEISQGRNLESILYNIAFVIAVFLCVVLHELGHALTAKRYGIQTKKITLLPIGGIASLDKIPESPKHEFLVTIAGPLVNLIIALLLYFVIPVEYITNQNFTEIMHSMDDFTLRNFLFFLFIANIGLVVFNLIPAFPMDGGRIFRSILAMNMNRVKATSIASSVGQFIAVVFLLIGLIYNPILIFIALFIFLGAYGENKLVQHFALMKGHKVKEAMMTTFTQLRSENTLDDVANIIISGSEKDFVVLENNEIKGVLLNETFIKNSASRELLVKDIMKTTYKTVSSNDDLKDVYELLGSQTLKFFPVLENNKLVGVIDLINLHEFLLLESKLEY